MSEVQHDDDSTDLDDVFEAAFEPDPEPDLDDPAVEEPITTNLGDEVTDTFGDMTDEEELEARGLAPETGDQVDENEEEVSEEGVDPENASESQEEVNSGTSDGKTRPVDLQAELDKERENNQKLFGKIRSLEGTIGTLKSDMQNLMKAGGTAARQTEAAGGEAPTADQVKQALADPEAMAELEKEFPEFAKIYSGLVTALEARFEGLATRQDVERAVDTRVTAVSEDTIEDVHPGWEKQVTSAEYAAWIDTEPEEIRRLENSSRPKDAIKLLDHFKEFSDWLADQPAEIRDLKEVKQVELFRKRGVNSDSTTDETRQDARERRQRRLEGATQPSNGRARSPARRVTVTEEDAFEAGFSGEDE